MNIKALLLPFAFLSVVQTVSADQLLASSESHPETDAAECEWNVIGLSSTPPDFQFPNGSQTTVYGLDCDNGPTSIVEMSEMLAPGVGFSCVLSGPKEGYRLEGNSCQSFAVFKSEANEDNSPAEPLSGLNRITNLWKPDQVVNVEHSDVAVSNAPNDWWSSHWIFEKTGNYYRIKNRWTNEYLHMQSHALESGPISDGWWSAQWTLQDGSNNGQTIYRIRNRWLPDAYLNIENGSLEAGAIEQGWHSAWWYIDNL
ncbi:RICIN domain-containing protein [Marinagarivorans cellulosilyticus]|uniref:Uncharacterized protein n=1 Tax=Marinagarivorans cellulosilyticus TaxID=2721545 RepID=A0AAN1WE63_9GAMM|nr:RICIN domain-containing protein [Marinagarivorans cellulosilyticus]BCD95938.1 hypothetical protein MARGE09_P0137 [Marinagarivorans cellulosilyticus]